MKDRIITFLKDYNFKYIKEKSTDGETCPEHLRQLFFSKKEGGHKLDIQLLPFYKSINIWSNEGFIYRGNCKSLNQFKKVCKLLNIIL